MLSTNTNAGQIIQTSFLGLQSYTEAQSNLFFGRDHETDALTSLVELNILTIVFGRSGTGKTSLLNAGVFPKLRKSFCLPFRIRLEFNDNSPDLLSQIKKVLKEEIDKYGFKVESYPASEPLWEYFHKEPLWKTVTPILVFDQFEEIFTLAKANPRFASAELPAFWEELSDLIENNIPEKLKDKFLNQKEKIEYNYKKPKAKVVFSFREEYLPEFESIAAKIPSLKYSRFRLLPMNGNQAYEVITKTWKENITSKEAKHIVSYFTNEPGVEDDALVTVEPSLLSQVCAYIDKGRIESGGGKVSSELLNKYPKETILRSIYEEATEAANNKLPADHEKKKGLQYNPVKVFLEEKLITSEGYRTKYNLGGNDELLRPAINELNKRYFIREDDNAVELTHDVVAPVIKTDREKRIKENAFAKLRKRVAIIAALLLLLGFGALAYFGSKAKNAIEVAKSANQDVENFKNLLAYKKDSLVKRVIDSLAIKDGTKGTIDALRAEIERLKKEAAKDPQQPVDDPDAEKRIIDLRNQVQLLLNDNSEKSLVIGKKNALLDSVNTDKVDLKNKLDKEKETTRSLQGQLNNEKDKLRILQKELDEKRSQIANLELKINDLLGSNTQLRIDKSDLEKRVKQLELDLDLANRQINELNQKLEAAKKNDLARINTPSTNPGNLRIQVYDQSGESRIPITKDTFFVYIIPYKAANKEILDDNKNILFANDCDGLNKILPELAQWQKGYFKDGYYYFHNVLPNGKYKIKICNILNGYFNLSLPSQSGNVLWKQTEKQKIAIKLGTF